MVNKILSRYDEIVNNLKNSNLSQQDKQDLLLVLKMFAMNKANENELINNNLDFVNEERSK